nr:MAG TPA: hypothetical protein [Caudoviricetes sp.]
MLTHVILREVVRTGLNSTAPLVCESLFRIECR